MKLVNSHLGAPFLFMASAIGAATAFATAASEASSGSKDLGRCWGLRRLHTRAELGLVVAGWQCWLFL